MRVVVFALGLLVCVAAHADEAKKSYAEVYAEDHGTCTADTCAPGTKVVVTLDKGDTAFACDTEEKSVYTNTVLGMVSFMQQMTGKLPNISPATGEPEVEGDSKALLDSLREKAGVGTFDEAVKYCKNEKQINKKKFMILNIKHESEYAWAGIDKMKIWLPLTAIKPVK